MFKQIIPYILLVVLVKSNVEDSCSEPALAPAAFGERLLEFAATYYDYHFVLSHHSVWQALAAAAEGTIGDAQEELLRTLRLPNDAPDRVPYYTCASTFERQPLDSFKRTTVLALDDALSLNVTWEGLVRNNSLIDVLVAPIIKDPQRAVEYMGDKISTNLDSINLSGDAVFLDAFDCNIKWPDSLDLERKEPFYTDSGEIIGLVDMISTPGFGRVAFAEDFKSTVLEVALDANSQYALLLLTAPSGGSIRDVLKGLQSSGQGLVPTALQVLASKGTSTRVRLPRFSLTVQHDNLRGLLEKMGVSKLWQDADAASLLSTPPARPSAFIQRASIAIDGNSEVSKAADDDKSKPVSDDVTFGSDIPISSKSTETKEKSLSVNHPFIFCLFDRDSKDCHVYGAYSEPIPYSSLASPLNPFTSFISSETDLSRFENVVHLKQTDM